MNVDSSSSATAEISSASNSSQTKSTSSSKKNESSSFDKELKAAESAESSKDEKAASKEAEKTASTDKSSEKGDAKNKQEDTDDLMFGLNASVNFTDFKYHNESQNLLSKNIQELINTKNLISANSLNPSGLKASISYTDNSMEMSDGDAIFFSDLVKNSDNMSMQTVAQQIQLEAEQGIEKTAKSAQVSSVLMEKLSESMKTNQPFRIDFDKDVSVIIKVNKDGSLMANFIPGDKAVEQYLKNNISFLKQRFDEQNLPYSDLNYSNSRQQQQEEQRRRNNKESGHE